MTNILEIIVLVLAVVGGYYLTLKAMVAVDIYKSVAQKNKKFRELESKRKKMLEEGEMHQWVELPDTDGNLIQVCEKTGWCPSKKGFLPRAAIDALKSVKDTEKEYTDYRELKMKQIAESNGMDVEKLESVYAEILSIKKDFYVKRMDDFLKAVGAKND
jgi:hypothetical protein